jgi:hypothetical protein
MTLIINTKNRRQERVVKAFLSSLSIGYHSETEEDAALLKAMERGRKSRLLSVAEKTAFLKKIKSAK